MNPVNLQRYYLRNGEDALEIMRELGLGITNADLSQIPEAGSSGGDWNMRNRLSGRILLQVQEHGEAWYVHPETLQRHYLGRPDEAYSLMRYQSLGITSANLETIPIAGTSTGLESYIDVDFVPQAPFADWGDLRQQEACEEASAFMAVSWATNHDFTYEEARDTFVTMSNWEENNWGYYHDTSAEDTSERILSMYLGFSNYEVARDISTWDIREELQNGNVVIVPINGQTIGNPYFVQPGPERHMILVVGFDASTNEFITKDPGTRHGDDLRYTESNMSRSLRDYTSGEYAPIGNLGTAMIVVKK